MSQYNSENTPYANEAALVNIPELFQINKEMKVTE